MKENKIYKPDSRLLEILLPDWTTKKDLIRATDNYASRGLGYQSNDNVNVFSSIRRNGSIIKPRVEKSKKEQDDRGKIQSRSFHTLLDLQRAK